MSISLSYVLRGVFAQVSVFSRTALCNSVVTHFAYIFHLVFLLKRFIINFSFRHVFLFQPDTVEPAMSSHSYEQPTSYGRPLGHSQK